MYIAIIHIYLYIFMCLYITSKNKILFHGRQSTCSELRICLIRITVFLVEMEVLVGKRIPSRIFTKESIGDDNGICFME